MQDFIETPTKPTLFSNSCEVAEGKYEPEISSEEAGSVTHNCENKFRENIITCKTPEKELFIKEVDGLSFDTVELKNSVRMLPQYIPIIDRNFSKKVALPSEYEYAGIILQDILMPGKGVTEKAGGLVETDIVFNTNILKEKAFAGKKVILFLTGPDTLIEWVWHKRDDVSFYQTLKDMGVYAVTGFNFSVMLGECPLAQTLNLKRSLHSTWLAEQAGILPIPHVYSISDAHVDKWIKWFKANPIVSLFAVNCQFQKSTKAIDITVTATSKILRALPDVHVLLQGFQTDHLHKLKVFGNRVHIADAVPAKFSGNKRKVAEGLAQFDLSSKHEELFSENLKKRTRDIKEKMEK